MLKSTEWPHKICIQAAGILFKSEYFQKGESANQELVKQTAHIQFQSKTCIYTLLFSLPIYNHVKSVTTC